MFTVTIMDSISFYAILKIEVFWFSDPQDGVSMKPIYNNNATRVLCPVSGHLASPGKSGVDDKIHIQGEHNPHRWRRMMEGKRSYPL